MFRKATENLLLKKNRLKVPFSLVATRKNLCKRKSYEMDKDRKWKGALTNALNYLLMFDCCRSFALSNYRIGKLCLMNVIEFEKKATVLP